MHLHRARERRRIRNACICTERARIVGRIQILTALARSTIVASNRGYIGHARGWTMLPDLDLSLEALLREHVPQELIAQTTITFATPDRDFPPPSVVLPAINLFLYDLHENVEYRSTRGGWEEQPDRTRVRRTPPVRVDCHYLVTAWARDGAPRPEQDEHRLLGAAMTALLRHREIPRGMLRGVLASSEYTVRASALRTTNLRSLAEFWQALGGRPKPSFNLVITLALDVHAVEEGGLPPDQAVFAIDPQSRS